MPSLIVLINLRPYAMVSEEPYLETTYHPLTYHFDWLLLQGKHLHTNRLCCRMYLQTLQYNWLDGTGEHDYLHRGGHFGELQVYSLN